MPRAKKGAKPANSTGATVGFAKLWRLAKMNLAIRGIDGQIAHGDTFHKDGHPDLKADYVPANPPFNDSDRRGEFLKDDKRWVYCAPSAGNANCAWVQARSSHDE